MKQHQEHDSSIAQEQADQVRRTTGATLAARALEAVLPALGKGYGPNEHRKAAAKMSENMDTPGFTPGPWTVRDGDTVVGPRGNVVAECCGYSDKATVPEQRAQGGRESNARLIAAAPSMFFALDGLLRACELSDDEIDAAIDAARAALSRARGGV